MDTGKKKGILRPNTKLLAHELTLFPDFSECTSVLVLRISANEKKSYNLLSYCLHRKTPKNYQLSEKMTNVYKEY